ncbi:hypothetical protein [Sandaracinobacteroides saxicola]|uniref:Uncharacterized protein n=1 Tax=Sandaracinobacteroides saxicola TaxID=2759707 RepID=A0A7G5IJS3_9SPHN|nr:hypothetical protein [Sandaracinobacteroides saxicola]QMW23615.1 hypothetical protein H3309_03735 [Sandaracinobacteroides saxicola]
MTSNEMVPSLMFMTLIAVLLLAVGALAWFWRKRANRNPVAREEAAEQAHRDPNIPNA